jgi:VRR-NUC domain
MKRRRPEQQIRVALADHLRLRAAAGTYWFHPANGGGRTAIEGAILKACGVRAGTPDIILIKSGKTYGLELKATNGRLSDAQQAAHDEMRAAGAEVAVAVGIDQALAQFETWGLLRGRAQ